MLLRLLSELHCFYAGQLAGAPIVPPFCSFSAHGQRPWHPERSEEHTSELQSLMRISYAVLCLKKKKNQYCQKNASITTNATQTTSITHAYTSSYHYTNHRT